MTIHAFFCQPVLKMFKNNVFAQAFSLGRLICNIIWCVSKDCGWESKPLLWSLNLYSKVWTLTLDSKPLTLDLISLSLPSFVFPYLSSSMLTSFELNKGSESINPKKPKGRQRLQRFQSWRWDFLHRRAKIAKLANIWALTGEVRNAIPLRSAFWYNYKNFKKSVQFP